MSTNYEDVRNLSFEEGKRYRIDFFGGIKAANVKTTKLRVFPCLFPRNRAGER